MQIKLRPKGVGIGFSDDEEEEEKEEKYFDDKDVVKTNNRVQKVETVAPGRVTAGNGLGNEEKVEIHEMTFEKTQTRIIDMTRRTQTTEHSPPPLASFLADLTALKRKEQSVLNQKQFELESALRQLERNIEEVERERARVAEIQKRNEINRIVGEFISCDFSDNFGSLCEEIRRLPLQDELVERAVISVLIPILQSSEVSLERMENLRRVLPDRLYTQIIYNLWWPSIRHPHFTAPIENSDDWQGVIDVLSTWASILPDDFLVSFIGNQILIPRIHSLLSCDSADAGLIVKVWRFLLELKFNDVIQILEKELITWLNDRIVKIQLKSFEGLLKEFEANWVGNGFETAWLKRCERLLQRDLIIDPSDQDLLPIECILTLNQSKFVPRTKLVHVLTINLIPKLKKCVQKWLISPSVDFEEVADWYVAWKDLFPPDLLAENEGELMNGFGEILAVINDQLGDD